MRNAEPGLIEQLSENSTPYRDPLAQIDWDALDTVGYWLPESALSLYGLPQYADIPLAVRQRLSQYEFVNVIQCGLWLERVFLQRLTRTLSPDLPRAEYQYVLHELREEAGHSLMFLKTIEASGLPLPPAAWRPPALSGALARWAPARGELFWLAMVLGEHLPDHYNRWLRQQGDAVHRTVREICTLHMKDEARHIVYARTRLDRLRASRGGLRRALLAAIGRRLLGQLAEVFYFPPARFYELAGLGDGAAWRRLALRNPVRRRFVTERLAPTERLLERCGLGKSA